MKPPPDWTPPPWQLSGYGIVLLYRFPGWFVEQHAALAPELSSRFAGGIGAVMCLDYLRSNIGPYRELLFIPGQVRVGGRLRWTISRIYVSTAASVHNGIRNWAIPKQPATFNTAAEATRFRAGDRGALGFDLHVTPFGPFLPADTRWLPLAAELAQADGNRMLVTRPGGRGAIRFARVERLLVDPAFFPDVSLLRPLAVAHVAQFELRFPAASSATIRATNKRIRDK